MTLSGSVILWSAALLLMNLAHLLGAIAGAVLNGTKPRGWYVAVGLCQLGLMLLLLMAVSLFTQLNTILLLSGTALLVFGAGLYWLDYVKNKHKQHQGFRAPNEAVQATPSSRDMETIFKHMTELVMVMDYRGVVVHVNHLDQLEALCPGCRRFVDLIGMLGRDSLRAHLGQLQKATTFPFSPLSITALHPHSLKHYQIVLEPISRGQDVLGYSAFIADVSELVTYTQQIEASNLALAQANQQLERHVQIESRLAEEQAKLAILTEIQRDLISEIEAHATLVHSIAENYATAQEIRHTQRTFQALADQIRNTYQVLRNAVKQMAQ